MLFLSGFELYSRWVPLFKRCTARENGQRFHSLSEYEKAKLLFTFYL